MPGQPADAVFLHIHQQQRETIMNHLDTLNKHFQKIAQIDHAITFLQWDQLVMMPPGGSRGRAQSIAELTTMRHELLCTPLLGELLAETESDEPLLQRSLTEMERERRQAVSVPAELVRAQSLAGSACEQGWRVQRRENDWQGFLENFNEVVALARQEAQARQSQASDEYPTPYDALLDLYCRGDDSTRIQQIFTRLKTEIPNIIGEVLEKHADQRAHLLGSFTIDDQKRLNARLMEILGFDFERGRLDVSLHPFSTGARGDQRITTRFRETDFFEALLATAHETGHASYENGLPERWDGLPIGSARNMCLHESQSLLFEKQLFLAPSFLAYFTPIIHEHLPQARQWSAEQICFAAARVEPSYIRVEADEVTYPLHIILRFEIEKELINGTLRPEDIPEIWDAKMQEYLGLSTKDNYTDGCLQDIHWTDGSFGYFPSYTMGAVNAAQLFAAITRDFPDWQASLRQGQTTFIRDWLGRNIWSRASSLDSQEILIQATGEESNPDSFLSHLRRRYTLD